MSDEQGYLEEVGAADVLKEIIMEFIGDLRRDLAEATQEKVQLNAQLSRKNGEIHRLESDLRKLKRLTKPAGALEQESESLASPPNFHTGASLNPPRSLRSVE